MQRYSLIHTKLPREFVLLQGTGCRWRQCTFCDYHTDTSDSPYAINRSVLEQVTGHYGVLDVINSGSAPELDEQTIALIQQVVRDKHIHTLWFEAHYMYRHRLAQFAALFEGVIVKFRCGIETFDPALRDRWHKGVPATVSPTDVAATSREYACSAAPRVRPASISSPTSPSPASTSSTSALTSFATTAPPCAATNRSPNGSSATYTPPCTMPRALRSLSAIPIWE